MQICRAAVTAMLVLAAACGKDAAKSKPEDKHPPKEPTGPAVDAFVPAFDERAIQVLPVIHDEAPPPARFAAALPRTVADLEALDHDDTRFPPRDYVVDALCRFATPSVLAAIDDAIAAETGAKRKAVVARWREIAAVCSGPPLCVSAAPIMAGPARPVQEVLKPTFDDQCATPKIAPADQVAWDATVEKLRAVGMLGPEQVAIPLEPHTEVMPFERLPFEVLKIAGRVDAIDSEGDGRSHAQPLRRIAHLVRPDLDGALFVETHDATGTVGLEAYVGGDRYTVSANPQDGWYDLDAAVGFINGILETRGSQTRVLALGGDSGQFFEMAAGPRAALHAAVRAGLIQAYDGGQ